MVKEAIEASLETAIERHSEIKEGRIIMLELPAEAYLESNVATIHVLTKRGYDGVYISFHRPFKSIQSLLDQQGIDTSMLIFIDVATACAREVCEESPQVMHISPAIEVDDLVRAIYTALPRLTGEKRFIFLDSLSTIALYKPLSETMRFSEFLIAAIRKRDADYLIFNVAQDLAQKKFIKDIAMKVDEVITVKP
jgi:KaiC/GvpD/RAD55 family RecA-like ATPase